MRYLEKSFNSTPPNDAYRDGHESTFGEITRKLCVYCFGTGMEAAKVDPTGGDWTAVPCPRGCKPGER